MQSFKHIVQQLRLFQGADSLEQLSRELQRLNSRRAVIFCGSTLGRAGSPVDLIRATMGDRCAGVYTGVRAKSPLPSVEDAALELNRLKADAVVAVGGGSAIVTARAASILIAENDDARSLCTTPIGNGRLNSPKLLAPKLPQLVIPTTPTTATVKAGSAVHDPVSGKRLALFDPKTRAQAVFIHPELIMTSPRALVVSAGLNTLAVAIEGLLSRSGDSISDALLMHAVRLLVRYLPAANRNDDLSVRAELMLASVMCGYGSDYTGWGIAITLGHAIGLRFDIDHGLANAIILPYALRFNANSAKAGLEKLTASLGLTGSSDKQPVTAVINALEAVFIEIGLPRRLQDVGVTRESIPDLAADSMEDWYLRNNPREVRDESELEQILREAW